MKDFFSGSFPKSTPGQVVRAHRKQMNLTLRELQDVTGIAQENLSAMENGKKSIGSDTALILGAALGIDAEFILFPHGYDSEMQKRVERARVLAAKLLQKKAQLLSSSAAVRKRKSRAA